jgi:hypothetical protein
MMLGRGSYRVAGYDWSSRDAWRLLRVVHICLSLPKYSTSLPRLSLSLGSSSSQGVLECLGLNLRVAEREMMAMGWPRSWSGLH